MRTSLVLLVLAASMSLSGCISNMAELKETLGVTEPEPTYLPPVARAQANATSVVTGVPVRFSADGTRDPQGLPVSFRWIFGGNVTRQGEEVAFAFPGPGEWRVILNVTNGQGLSDEASLVVQVAQANRPPTARILVFDDTNQAVEVAEMGAPLRFVADVDDPDGNLATVEWDFGRGATSHDRNATHAFEAPGLHTVKLRALDAGGLSTEASRLVAVNGAWRFEGGFEPADGEVRAHAFRVAEGAREVRATLTFPASLGGNDLTLVLRDAKGQEVARSTDGTAPGEQGEAVREVVLAGEALRAGAFGEWTASVVKAKGVQVEYALVVRETF